MSYRGPVRQFLAKVFRPFLGRRARLTRLVADLSTALREVDYTDPDRSVPLLPSEGELVTLAELRALCVGVQGEPCRLDAEGVGEDLPCPSCTI